MSGVDVESGVEWISTVPEHWKVRKLRYSVKIPNGHVDPKLDGFRDQPLIAPNHIESGTGRLLEFLSADEQGAESSKYQFNKGDVLYSKIRPELAKACVTSIDGLCSADMYPLKCQKGMVPGFLAYLLISPLFTQYVVLASSRVAMPKVNRGDLGDCHIPIPPIEEQQAIADYLDHKTAGIDALIAGKRRMIDLLHEKRQALISEAVTKGLDPDVPMRDSGIPWFGVVPIHWSIERLKYSTTRIEQGWSPQCESRPADFEEWGVLKVGCVNGEDFDPEEQKALPSELEPIGAYEVRQGDILMSRGNTRELVGSAALVKRVRPRLLLCDLLYRLRSNRRAEPEFLVLSLRSPHVRFQIEREATGTSSSMKKVGQETIRELIVCLPPLDEQRDILQRLRPELDRIDSTIDVVQKQIDRLREYRQTLISAAVTGKIDVRSEGSR